MIAKLYNFDRVLLGKIFIKTFTILLFIQTSIYATTTNKTFLATRSQNSVLPIELSLTNELLTCREKKPKGLNTEIAPFFYISTNSHDLAKYFFFNQKSQLQVGDKVDIDNRYLKFNEESATHLTGTLKISPREFAVGFYFKQNFDLSKFIKHTSLSVLTSFCRVSTDPRMEVENSVASSEDKKTIADYFEGQEMFQRREMDDTIGVTRSLQEALKFGKMKGPQAKIGFSDLLLLLNYDLVDQPDWFLRVSGLLTIPTNRGSTANVLFEPRIGNGGHFSLGFGVSGSHNILSSKCGHILDIVFNLRYQYLIHSHEKRILGLKNKQGTLLNFAQYMLFGFVGVPQVVPAANVLVQDVKVFPRSEFEGAVMLSYTHHKLTINFGYDAWVKHAEKLKRYNKWDDELYGLVGSNYLDDLLNFDADNLQIRNSSHFSISNSNLINVIQTIYPAGLSANTQGLITSDQLDTTPARSSSAFTSTLFFAIGYIKDHPKATTYFGFGGFWEISFKNNALARIEAWFKAGLFF